MANKAEETTHHPIFDSISQGDLAEFKNHLAQHKGSVDFFDENGMTALQHASYKGSKEMVQLLLDRGANVSFGNHEYNYTALHFGALSGNSEVCTLLLNAGAQPQATNSVGRTAAQMAAFVGNHHSVATINNFFPRCEIASFAVPGEGESLIPAYLVDPLHKFVMGANIHPVRLALNIQNKPVLLELADKCNKVLNLLCKSEMIKGSDTNEVMAFKFHYLAYLFKGLIKVKESKQKTSAENEEKKHDIVEVFAKKLLKPGRDGYSLDMMDVFLKECVREFPYRESTTFHQMVSSLTSKDPPPALTVINCTINGQRAFMDPIPYCSTCGEEKPAKKCSKCKTVQYCDRECQRLHWFVHKKACNREFSASTPSNPNKNIDVQELTAELQNLVAG